MVEGLYACGVNSVNGGQDIQTYYKVRIYKIPAKADNSHLEVKKGYGAKLLSKALFGHQMSYCRFTTPNGEVHGMSDRFTMDGNLRYYGAGLRRGDCGLEVVKVDLSHFGIWKNTFMVDDKEYTIEFVISEKSKLLSENQR